MEFFSVTMLSVAMLSVSMLNVVMLSVMAPYYNCSSRSAYSKKNFYVR